MFAISIELLEYGWADMEIIIDGHSSLVVFENTPNDALEDLLQSAIRLVTYGDSSTISFPNGPEKEVLSIENIDDTNCKVSVNQHFEELPAKHCLRTILRLFDKYIHAHSIEKYETGWNRSFPSKELDLLRKKYGML